MCIIRIKENKVNLHIDADDDNKNMATQIPFKMFVQISYLKLLS